MRMANQTVDQPAGVTAAARRRPLHLFVLIDALGWSYIEGRDFLNDILPHRQPLRTVLGYSSGAIPTILTGALPAQNKHWNLLYYDPQGSPFRWLRWFSLVPDYILNHRITTKLLKEMGKRLLGLGPLFECAVKPSLLPWFNWVEKRNIYDRRGIVGSPSIFDRLAEGGIPYHVYTYHRWTDAQIFGQVRRDMQSSEAGFYFLYLCEMDGFLHMSCRDEKRIGAKLDWYATELRKLYTFARTLDPDVSLSIFSDHGMTPIEREYDLMSEIEKLGWRMPKDYLAVYDSTMARFWFFSEDARKSVMEALRQSPCGRTLSESELRSLGIWFDDRRYGELVFLLHPGWLLARSDFNGPRWSPAGMHGYHPDDRFSDGIFLASREPPVKLNSIADVYACMWESVT
jgi:hypothetical protein